LKKDFSTELTRYAVIIPDDNEIKLFLHPENYERRDKAMFLCHVS
jgi:hypothetical protein